MPNWKKLIVSGSDASLNSLNVTNNVTAQSFTGSFSGSFTAPGATTQVVYNNGGVLAANSGFVYSGSNVGIGTTNPSYKLNVYESNTAEYISAKFQTTHPNLNYILLQNGGGSFNHYIQTNSGTLGLSADENGSSGVIQLKTNNVIAVTVNTSQNVGIGTTSPTYKLDLVGSYKQTQGSGGIGLYHITTANADQVKGVWDFYTNTAVAADFFGRFGFKFEGGVTDAVKQFQVHVADATTPKLVVAGSGNVGIGTISPTVKLDVSGSVNIRTAAPTITFDRNGSYTWRLVNGDGGTYPVSTFNIANNAGTASATFLDNGNVGIGTTTPASALHIIGSNIVNIVESTSSVSYTQYYNSSTGAGGTSDGLTVGVNGTSGVIYLRENADLFFGTADTERMRITSTGNVGIGTSTPTSKLDVIGNSYISGSLSVKTNSTAGTGLTVGGSTVLLSFAEIQQGNTLYLFSSGNTYYSTIRQDSQNLILTPDTNVGIGTVSPTAKLEVAGNVKATSFTGSFSGSFTAPGSTTQIVYNDNGVLAANSGLVYSGSNVGIGISSPTEKLHIVSSATGNQFGRITATDSNSSAAWVAQNDSGDNVVYRVFSSGVSGTQMGAALGRSASLLANLGGSGVFLLGTFSNTNFVLGTNNTERMRITTAGDVGIGTTSPETKLHVASGDVLISNGQYYSAEGNTGGNYKLAGITSGNVVVIGAIDYTTAGTIFAGGDNISITTGGVAGTSRLNINSAGNVGIGTTSPGYKLDVAGYTNTAGFFSRGANIGLETQIAALGTNGAYQAGYYLGATNTVYAARLGMDVNSGDVLISAGNTGSLSTLAYFKANGNIGIGTSSPGYKLEVVGAVSASTYYGDGSNLTNIGSGSVSAAGSDGQLQYNNSGLFGGASRLYYNDTTNKVGIGTSSPGYDLDVSGSVRVQDKLRVGPINTGNGVIHQSSDATINASSSTIVWSVPGSSGAVAFIEYYIINTVTSTSQRGGNIVVTWNSAGTPQITHTETTTPDIGTTALVTFTTSMALGGDPQLVATNTSINPFYIVLNYRYF